LLNLVKIYTTKLKYYNISVYYYSDSWSSNYYSNYHFRFCLLFWIIGRVQHGSPGSNQHFRQLTGSRITQIHKEGRLL